MEEDYIPESLMINTEYTHLLSGFVISRMADNKTYSDRSDAPQNVDRVLDTNSHIDKCETNLTQ